MLEENREKFLDIIEVLGEEKIEKVYQLIGSEKLSFSTLMRQIRKLNIITSMEKNQSITEIAKSSGVSRMTVYREMKCITEKK